MHSHGGVPYQFTQQAKIYGVRWWQGAPAVSFPQLTKHCPTISLPNKLRFMGLGDDREPHQLAFPQLTKHCPTISLPNKLRFMGLGDDKAPAVSFPQLTKHCPTIDSRLLSDQHKSESLRYPRNMWLTVAGALSSKTQHFPPLSINVPINVKSYTKMKKQGS